MIPKGVGEYCGIGLVEVMFKSVVVVLNCRFTASIAYHDSFHGFWSSRVMVTTTLEFKLIQQVASLR